MSHYALVGGAAGAAAVLYHPLYQAVWSKAKATELNTTVSSARLYRR